MVSLAAALAAIPILSKKFEKKNREFNFDQIFVMLIDTFIPADEYPGAVDIGLDQQLLSKVRENRTYFSKMFSVINIIYNEAISQYSLSFDALDLDARHAIIAQILLTDFYDQNTHIQVKGLRAKVITHFYNSSVAFKMLAYHPPSQGGYPDYAIAPV